MTRNRAVGLLCGVLSVLFFSSFTLVSRLGFSSSLRLQDAAALRFGIGGVLLLPVLLRRGLSGLRWRDAGALAFFGGLGFALLAYSGFALAPAAHGAVLLHGTLSLFTFAILGATSRRSGKGETSLHWQRPRLLGLLLIGAGVALMAYDSVTVASLRQLLGDGLLLLASISWSTYGVLMRRPGLSPAHAAAIVAVFSMAGFLPVYALLPGRALFQLGARELLLQAAVQGVLVGAVSIFVYTQTVVALGPATASLFTAAVPGVTTLAAVPLLSEYPSVLSLFGVGVVTLGMVLTLRRRGRA